MAKEMEFENVAAFRSFLTEAMTDLVKDNPEVIMGALAGNKDALRSALSDAGVIVSGEAAEGDAATRAVREQYQAAKEDGRVVTGPGARYRRELRSVSYRDQSTGAERRTYLFGEQMELAEAWFRAFLDAEKRDQKTGKNIREIADLMNKGAARAPSFPFTAEPGTGGGFLVPQTVAAEIFEVMNERFVLRDLVEVFTSAAPLRIPRRLTQMVVSRGGASTNISQVDPASTLGAVTLSPERVSMMAYIDPLLALAAAVGPVRWVVGQFAEAMAKDYQRVIISGDPTLREPRGINQLPTSGQSTYDQAITATFDNTDIASRRTSIRKLYYGIAQPHRESNRFVFIVNNDGLQLMASLNDLNQQPFRDQTIGAPFASYLGKRVVESTAITTATNQSSILCGDFSQYAWLESPDGLRIEQTNVGGEAWVSDSLGVKMVQSLDGAPITPPTFGIMNSVNV